MLSIAVVCEADADFRTASCLADRALVDAVDWLEPEHLKSCRSWQGLESSNSFLKWSELKTFARQFNIAVHGHFGGEPAKPDARAAKRSLRLLIEQSSAPPDAVLFVRDQDDEPDTRNGLDQARAEFAQSFPEIPVVIGFAVVERESWVLSGFVAQNGTETDSLARLRQALGFHPTQKPERLTACKDDQAKRSPKRVLSELTGNDRQREDQCVSDTSLDQLSHNGTGNGLSEFLTELRDLLAPRIGHTG